MTPSMAGAINDGMINSNVSIYNVPANCPTTNCTWEAFNTLSFCSSVEDVSDSLTLDRTNVSKDCGPLNANSTAADCLGIYTLPSPDYLNTDTASNSSQPARLPLGLIPVAQYGTMWFMTTAPNEVHPNQSAAPNLMFDIFVVYSKNLSVWPPEMAAAKGTISLCLRSIKTDVSNGITSTKLVGNGIALPLQGIGEVPQDQMFCANVDGDATKYCSDAPTIGTIRNYLSTSGFNGSADISYNRGADDYFFSTPVRNMAADLYGSGTGGIADMAGFAARMENLALSMTNQ
jgi:hypothetical protein